MTTANHVLAGTLIAVTVKQPMLVLPLALASHYLLDAMPHHGDHNGGYKEVFKYKSTYVLEMFGVVGIFMLLYTIRHEPLLVFLAGFTATLPDLMWPYRYFFFERKNLHPPGGPLTHFHQNIQKLDRLWGIYFEIPIFIAGFMLLRSLMN